MSGPDEVMATIRRTGDVLTWVDGCLTQIERFANAFLAETREGHPEGIETPRHLVDGHLALVAMFQVETSLDLAGAPRLSPNLHAAIGDLRDLHQQWEQLGDARTAVPWVYRLDEDDIWIGHLRLEDLWRELLGVEERTRAELADALAAAGHRPPPAAPPLRRFPERNDPTFQPVPLPGTMR